MKNLNSKLIFFVICLSLLAVALPARAEETRTIRLKIAAFDQILFNDDFVVHSCPDSDNASSTNSTVNAWCAVDQIIVQQGWTAISKWYSSYGVMLNSINQYDGSDWNYWLWFSNSELGATALSQHLLTDGEKLLLTYGTSPLKLIASSTTPAINSTSTLSASYFDVNIWQWTSVATSTFVVNGQEVATSTSAYQLWTSTTTPYVITAKKAGFLDSDPITVIPQLPSINIKLQIETASSTLANKNMTVSACEKNIGSGIYTINGRCALEQSGLQTHWTDWGTDSFLDSIDNYSNNQSGNGIYWLWFGNLDYGQTALNNHVLVQGEELLLIYGKYPLRIQTATTTPYVNSTSTLVIEQFGFDSAWNPVWSPASSSTFVVNGQEIPSPTGTHSYLIATTTPYSILGRKDGFLDSPVLVLTGIIQNSEAEQGGQSGSAGGRGAPASSGSENSGSTSHQNINIDKAITFLSSNQNSDGSIGSSILYSDWTAIALSAYGDNQTKNKLKNYLIGAGYNTDFGFRTTDLERRAMALMALGVNPYNGTATDFISKIVSAFDNTQIGDPQIFNDDIFALFPLLKAGYSGSDRIVDSTIRFILSKQNANGSWENVDLTAAAIQAFSLALKTGNLSEDISNLVSQALQKAKNFLRNSQGQNGGFYNNAISTSWVIQAISALGEPISSWENNNQNPIDFLASHQKNDGGFEEETADISTRIWTTAYAIPAALGKTWGEILNSFSKPVQNFQNVTSNLPETSATSTPEQTIDTSIPTVSTSTPITENNQAPQNATSILISNLPQTATSTPELKIKLEQTNGQIALAKPVNLVSEPRLEERGDDSQNETQQNEPDKKNKSLNLTAQASGIIIPGHLTWDNATKIIFYLSAGIAILLGLYLALKFIMVLF